MSKNLFQIVNDQKAINDLLAETGGEITDDVMEKTVESWVKEVMSDLSNKVDGYRFRTDLLKKLSEQFKEYENTFYRSRNSLDKLEKNLKERLKMAMLELNKSEISGNLFTYKLSTGKKKLVLDETKLDRKYYRQVIVDEIDKESLMTDLESGIKVEGAVLEDTITLRPGTKK